MIRTMLAFLVALFAANAEAQAIRSGEHTNFTRFVVPLPPGATWQIGLVDGGYLLRLDEAVEFDTTQAFNRIARTRVTDLIQMPSGLLFQSDCDCHIDVFTLDSNQIVLDFFGGSRELPDAFEPMFDERSTAEREPSEPQEPAADATESVNLPLVTTFSDSPALTLPLVFSPNAHRAGETNPNSEAREDLLASISRGAAQGMISPVEPVLPDIQTDEIIESATTPDPDLELPETGPQLRAETAIEREQQLFDLTLPVSNIGSPCLPDEAVDIANWGPPDDPYSAISTLQAGLFDERDNVRTDVALDLARLQIHLGFGAEARQTLSYAQDLPDAGLLTLMSRIIEGRDVDPEALASQLECDGAIALWAMIASDSVSADTAISPPAILQSFAFLTPMQKRILSGPLVDRFRRAGEYEAAEQVLRLTDLENTVATAERNISEANLDAERGDIPAAEDLLEDTAFDPIESNPEALARLIELQLDEGLPVARRSLELAAALSFELGESEAGRRLKTIEIRGWIQTGELARSERMIEEFDPESSSLWTELADAHVTTSDFPIFLRFAVDEGSRQIADPTRFQMARRLLDDGLPDAAETLLGEVTADRMSEEEALLRAEISARRGDYDLTTQLLAGVDMSEATPLRMQAALRSGDPDLILKLAQETGNSPDVDQAWRAGAWDVLSDLEAPSEVSAAATVMADPTPETPSESALGPTLEARRLMLSESRETRAVIDALLERYPAPDDGG